MRVLAAILSLIALFNAQVASAQEWTVGAQPVDWVASPAIGDGVDRHAEVSSADQGGDPPALDYEPAAIDENGLYTRSEWISSGGINRVDQGEAKFRITCNFSHFGDVDPIVYPDQTDVGHHHTFIGNKGTDESSDYTSLRNAPASTCSGGPLNGTAYWEPTLFYEIETGIFVPVKPNIVSFYYTLAYADVEKMYRLLRGLAFIGGVDPADRLNTVRLAEIPDGQGWMKTRRYNGWNGWQCFDTDTNTGVNPTNGGDVSAQQPGYARQLVNADGSDPWDGACEGLDKLLIASNAAPSCWDGHNLTSVGGRDHFRYPIVKTSAQQTPLCPDGWWKVPHFEVKSEFPNGRTGVLNGHAWRSKLHLSSDRHGLTEANWHPRGSTFHFDWMNGWDSVIQALWQDKCTGTDQNGNIGEPLTCGDSTISATQRMFVLEASPDSDLSNDPVITAHDYETGPSKEAFGPVETGTEVDATIEHNH